MTDDLNALQRRLQQEADEFLMRHRNETTTTVQSYVVCDLEFSYDYSRHQGYVSEDKTSAETRVRWPFHRIAAASWIVLRVGHGQHTPDFEDPVVLSVADMTEVGIVQAFFAALWAEPGAKVVTWGGEAKDLAVLRFVGAEHGLLLPRQIADLSPLSGHRIDLCNATAVRADSVHLPEYASALSIPSKPSPSKSVGKLVERENWDKVEEQVLADVMTTTVILIMHLTSQGMLTCERADTLMALGEVAVSAAPANEFARRTFLPWARGRKATSGLRGKIYRAA